MIFDANLEAVARERGLMVSKTASFWFRRKYNLPPNDPRFMSMTLEDIQIEYWAHHFYDKPDSEFEAFTDDYDAEVERMISEADPDDLEDV